MANSSATYDVFISHSASDKDLAGEIASACEANELRAFTGARVPAGENLADAIWDALSESRAVIAIMSQPELTPSMAIELGGARAWNKPIFAVLTDPSRSLSSAVLGNIHVYTSSRIDDVIRAIQRSGEEFSQADLDSLAAVYSDAGVTVDQLAFDARLLESLVGRFAHLTGKTVTGERLLSELLRMRKQGRLATNFRKQRTKPNKGAG